MANQNEFALSSLCVYRNRHFLVVHVDSAYTWISEPEKAYSVMSHLAFGGEDARRTHLAIGDAIPVMADRLQPFPVRHAIASRSH